MIGRRRGKLSGVGTIGYERLGIASSGHRRIKSITPAGDRLDQSWTIVPKLPPQFADALHQGVVRDGQIRPDRCKELVFRNEAAGIFDKALQDREGFRSKRDLATLKQEATAIQVQDIMIERQSLCLHLHRRVGIASSRYLPN
jgi:hypothetical protein